MNWVQKILSNGYEIHFMKSKPFGDGIETTIRIYDENLSKTMEFTLPNDFIFHSDKEVVIKWIESEWKSHHNEQM